MTRARERYYDSIAADFDHVMNRYDLERRIEVVFGELLRDEDLRGRRVLDAGSGTGSFSARALDRGAAVVAADIGAGLLTVAREKGIERVVASDVGRLPFQDGTFDVVVSSECIEHTRSPRDSVRELARVLRPGGVLALTCPNKFWRWSCTIANVLGLRPYRGLENWPSWGELARWLGDGGMTIERHVGLHLFPFVLPVTQPLLRRLDRAGSVAGPLFVNQCIRAVKLPAGPPHADVP